MTLTMHLAGAIRHVRMGDRRRAHSYGERTQPPVVWNGNSYAICLPWPPEEMRSAWLQVDVTPRVTYVVRVRESGSEEWLVGVETPLTSCIGLKPDTEYEMELRAKNAAGEGSPAVASFRTDATGAAEPISTLGQ